MRGPAKSVVLDLLGKSAALCLPELCAQVTSTGGKILFLGEWDAALSMKCAEFTLVKMNQFLGNQWGDTTDGEIVDLPQGVSNRNAKKHEPAKRRWNDTTWTFAECQKFASERKSRPGDPKREKWMDALNAAVMWFYGVVETSDDVRKRPRLEG